MAVTDLVPLPLTGEAIDLAASDDVLADTFDRIRDLERQLREARDMVASELIRRMDRSAKWSMHTGGWEVKAPSPAPAVEWDVDALRATLRDLRSEGVIGSEAEEAVVEPVVEWKVRVRGINALRKLGSDVSERLDACSCPVEKPRRIQVKRAA